MPIKTLETIEAINLLKQKTWVDLTHAFGPDSPHFSAFEDAKFDTLFNHDDGFFAQRFTFPGQYGTHLDAPVHFVRDARYLHELGLKELILPLIVIDKSKEAEADPDFTLGIDGIEAFEAEHGKIEADTFVALRTDWSKRWPDKEAFDNKDEEGNSHAPGWSVEALKFLFEERGVRQSAMKRSTPTPPSTTAETERFSASIMYSTKTPTKSSCSRISISCRQKEQ